jgi:hypothetical protein
MRFIDKPLIAGLFGLAIFALTPSSHAADITWGSPTNITAVSDISSTGVTSLAGANFGNPSQVATTPASVVVNNGSVDVTFTRVGSNASAALTNGITVTTSSAWELWGYNSGNSSMAGNYGVVLDTNLGIETATSATITLSGLTIGTQYQFQFFADSTGSNSQTISGSAAMNTLGGQFVTGTFTADATSQALTMTRNTDFGVANALTIGVISGGGPDTTPPAWIATWPQADPLSTTSLTVRAQTNETGTAYYVVLANGTPHPPPPKSRPAMTATTRPPSGAAALPWPPTAKPPLPLPA